MNADVPQGILLGRLSRQTLINAQKQVYVDQAGGGLLYAAAGSALWGVRPGFVARVGQDYPRQWIAEIDALGFDTSGIRILPQSVDLRHFIAYRQIEQALHENPIKHFAELGMPMPKSLLGYQAPKPRLDSRKTRSTLTLRSEDLPAHYARAKAAHLCPLDYISHSTMPPLLREKGVRLVSVAASNSYMHPDFWNDVAGLVNGLSAFISTENQMRTLFSGRSHDLWEMAEWLGSQNCACVVIQRGKKGQILFDAQGRRRYRIAGYPARAKDVTGGDDAFGGAFLAGLQAGHDALHTTLQGAVAASLAAEGSGPFYVLDSSPGLAQSRLQALEQAVQLA